MPKTYSTDALAMEQRMRASAVKVASTILTAAQSPDASMFETLREAVDRYEASLKTRIWSNTGEVEYVIESEC